jgi:4-aminobutyrate aminotransferase-like enzyme
VLFPLVGLRVCATTTSAAQQAALEPENQYVQEFAAAEWPTLDLVAGLPPALAHAMFRQACGLEPHPRSPAVQGWLRANAGQLSPLLNADLTDQGVTVLDLSVGSDDLRDGVWERPGAVRAHIARALKERGSGLGLGRHAEARLSYTRYDSPVEPETIHLGVEVFVPAETAVFAPLEGSVARLGWNELIVRHEPAAGCAFYTRYAGLAPADLLTLGGRVQRGQVLGRVASADVGAPLPPHLHFQLACDLPGDLPALAAGAERAVWLSICPDPNLVLNIPGLQPAQDWPPTDALLARRRSALAQSQETYYRRPMQIVRGWRQYLLDDAGRAYLDAINNVAHVGHGQPQVVAAAQRQMTRLNTNNRFVYASLVEFAERLQALLPEALSVVFLVNSGSEANDLALRLARTYTGSEHVLTIDGAYHGNTTAVYEVSTSILDNPTAAKAVKPYIHPVLQPNTFRGPHGADDPQAGRKYAAAVEAVLADLQARGARPAAFIGECLLGAPGGILPPAGYFPRVYTAVRAAGGVCIADEVQVGLGRVGTHMWAFEMQGVVPDIVTLGKPLGNGFPVSAVVTTPVIAEAFRQKFTYFNTFGGNPVACAAGLAVLDVLRAEGLQAQARDVGAYFKAGLEGLLARHPLVGAVYGQGLYLGVDLVRDRESRAPATAEAMAVCERMRDYGIIVYPTGDYYNILKIKPPLVFTRANADFFVTQLDRVLSEGW